MIVRELFMCSVVAVSVSVAAQDPVSSMIEPTYAATVIGQSQAFLLLGRDGQEISASNWTASGPDLADLQVDGAHAILTPKAKGQVALGSGDGARAGTGVVDPSAVEGSPPNHAKWTLQPIDGEFTSVLWATGAWDGSRDRCRSNNRE